MYPAARQDIMTKVKKDGPEDYLKVLSPEKVVAVED
jgi:hypothetical protein